MNILNEISLKLQQGNAKAVKELVQQAMTKDFSRRNFGERLDGRH